MNECKECRYFDKRSGQRKCNLGNDQTIGRRCGDWEPVFISATRNTFVPESAMKGERK